MTELLARALRFAAAGAARLWLALVDPTPVPGRDEDDDPYFVLGGAGPVPPPPITKPRAVVRAQCPWCGAVEVPASNVEGVFYRNALHLSWYGIVCPKCCQRTIKSAADERTRTALLAATGADISIELVPAEALEERPAGRALTLDDVLDAHLWLEACDDLAAAAQVIDVTDGGAR